MAGKISANALRPGLIFIISAPSGAGKTTLVQAFLERDPGAIVSISHTTRPPRQDEVDGVSYHFIDEAAFTRMVASGEFLEHARVFDHRYGTAKHWVQAQRVAGKDVILEIDWQGARQIRSLVSDAISIFILPPSLGALEQRLRARGDKDATVARRMQDAREEISHYAEYEYLIVNDKLEVALHHLGAIVQATRHRYPLFRPHYDARIERMLQDGGGFE